MSFEALTALLRGETGEGSIDALPYAQTLGLRYLRGPEGITLHMPFAKPLIGAPNPRLHGGTIAGLLEIAAIAQLIHVLRSEAHTPGMRPINVTVDYLRGGAPEDSFAAASITRLGRRIANIRAEAWQGDRSKPIAGAHMNIMLDRE